MANTETTGARYEVVTPPSYPAVLVEKARERLGIEGEEHDFLIQSLVPQCCDELERYACLSLFPQTRQVTWDSLGEDQLLYGPVTGHTAVDGLTVGTGVLARVRGEFPDGVSLTYQAGYTMLPPSWEGVLLSLIRERFETESGMTVPGAPQPKEYWKTVAARLRPLNPFS